MPQNTQKNFWKHRRLGPTPRVSNSVLLEWSQRISFPNRFPGDSEVPALWSSLLRPPALVLNSNCPFKENAARTTSALVLRCYQCSEKDEARGSLLSKKLPRDLIKVWESIPGGRDGRGGSIKLIQINSLHIQNKTHMHKKKFDQ